jgi:cell wall-associated NlpC family hydrolase
MKTAAALPLPPPPQAPAIEPIQSEPLPPLTVAAPSPVSKPMAAGAATAAPARPTLAAIEPIPSQPLPAPAPAPAPAAVPHAVPHPLAAPSPVPMASAGAVTALPSGTPLHLKVIYSPWAPQASSDVASLTARLQSQVDDIATARASVGPVQDEAVAYFFPDDRAGATAVAASLARLTKRAEPVRLLRTQPLPRPGTIEILIPRKSGKELTNESS